MQIIDGKHVATIIKEQLKGDVKSFKERYNREIVLAVVLVGDNVASQVYVRNKVKAAEFVGIKSLTYTLPTCSNQFDVEKLVVSLANNNLIDGILVQLPLPKGIDESYILSLIPPEKDVDGFTDINIGRLLLGKECTVSCTPKGIIRLLKYYNVELCGKNAVVVGRSNIVGKPISFLLLKENCTVTICHSKTKNIDKICKNADILVVAIGKPKFISTDMVKNGAVVIDVGINRTDNGIVGDVDFDNVKGIVSMITPVPGGVGPMTIAMLMENTLECAKSREKYAI